MASKTINTFNTAVTSSMSSSIQDKWVINLSKKELTPEEKSLLQKGPKFAVTQATIPIKEYISTTTVAAVQADELNGVDCSGLYHDSNRILNTLTNKLIHPTKTSWLQFPSSKMLWSSQNPQNNMPMHPIVSACGTATYNTAKFITKILQNYSGKTSSFVKDSTDFIKKLNISQ